MIRGSGGGIGGFEVEQDQRTAEVRIRAIERMTNVDAYPCGMVASQDRERTGCIRSDVTSVCHGFPGFSGVTVPMGREIR